MLVLVFCSGFFSGSETAFFNLSPRQRRLLRESGHRLQIMVGTLLQRPGHLLNGLLFGNMVVNVLYFSLSSVLTMTVKSQAGLTAAAVAAFLSFILLVLFGEILPKSFAYASSRSMSLIAAGPAFLWLKVFAPFQFAFKTFILEPVLRISLGSARTPRPLSIREFRSLIQTTRRQGLISSDENRLLTEVIELGFLKVRHVMRPRVDMIACSASQSPEEVTELLLAKGLTKLPVYEREIDNIIGMVYFRRLLLEGDAPLKELVDDVHFVPEQKTVESLLEFFRRSRSDTAVVVDEYGGIAGLVRLEDIAEELFGQIEPEQTPEAIEQTGPFEYRMAGSLPIHDWAESFGIDVNETRICTVGGLVTAMLGRIPKPGDKTTLENLKFTVEKVRMHRIDTLILTLEPIDTNGQ